VAGLKVQILQETKARDAAVKDKSDALAVIEESLRSNTQLVEQLTNDINTVRKEADDAIKVKENELKRMDTLVTELQKKALDEKASIESQMQAELDQLRRNSEEAVSRLKSELKMQQSAVADAQAAQATLKKDETKAKADAEAQRAKQHAENMAKAKAEADEMQAKNQAAEKKIESAQQEAKARSKPKGFGKPAMKKTPPRQVTTPAPSPQVMASGSTLKQLAKPTGRDSSFPVRKSQTQTTTESGRTRGNNALSELLNKSRQATVQPPSRAATKNPLTSLIKEQGTDNSSQAFPERKKVEPPSSQASTRRQGAPAQQVDSPASTILGEPNSKNPLTSLIKESSEESFPARKSAAPPSSQASDPVGSKMSNLVDVPNKASFPFRKGVSPPSSQASASPPAVNKLTELLVSIENV